MAGRNILRGQHAFMVGEGEDAKEYRLVLDANAFIEVETILDTTLPELFRAVVEKPSLRLFRAILYGSLTENHPEMTLRDAGDLIAEVGFERITKEIEALVLSVMPSATEGNGVSPVTNRATLRATGSRGTGPKRSKPGAKPGSSQKRSGSKRQG